MSQKYLKRYHLLKSVLEDKITLTAAAGLMEVSLRQARRLKNAVVARGATGVKHGNTGRSPCNTIELSIRNRVIVPLPQTTLIKNKLSCYFIQ